MYEISEYNLVDAFIAASQNIDAVRGQAFNIGGGAGNTMSLVELIEIINTMHGKKTRVEFDDWRTGDQKYYISNTRKFQQATGWLPTTSVHDGIAQLYAAEWSMD